MFDVSETAGYPVDERKKVEIFRETVCAHPLVLKVLEEFDFDFPDARTCTYTQICEFLILHLPNIKHASSAATKASANLVTATAYATLEAESKRLKREVETLKRKQTPTDNKKQRSTKQKGKRKGTDKRETDQSTNTLKYCHGHGYQRSHISSECKLLAGDNKFNAAMRNAKDPHHPPGGSTKINGQVAPNKPKNVTANITHRVAQTVGRDQEDDDWDEADSDCLEETTMFLTDVLGDQTDEYTTTQTTAMMMQDESLLLDDETVPQATRRVPFTNEVPRLTLGANQGGQIHVNRGDNMGNLIQSSSSSVDQATDEVEDEMEESVPHTYALITDGRQFRSPFWF